MRLFCLGLVLAALGCAPTEPSGPDVPDGFTNFTARIDGVAWNAEFAPTVENPTPGLYGIYGFRLAGSAFAIFLTLSNISGPGTYPLGVNVSVKGGSASLSGSGITWWTAQDGAAGEVVITTLTATRIVGTFSFVGAQLTDPLSTRAVTEGQFDITFIAGAGVAGPSLGASFTGDIGGTFRAANVSHQLVASPPLFVLLGMNPVRTVTISLSGFTGPGGYTLDGPDLRTITVVGAPGNAGAVWRSYLTGGGGSVTISSMTADRIEGTFTATLMPEGSGATGVLTISGTFSVGRGGP